MTDNNVWSKADGGEGERIFPAFLEEAILRRPWTIVSVLVWLLFLADFFFFTVPDYTKFQSQFQTGIFVKSLGNICIYIKCFCIWQYLCTLEIYNEKLRKLKAIRLTLCKVMLIKQLLSSWWGEPPSHYLWVRNHTQIEKGVSWNRQ